MEQFNYQLFVQKFLNNQLIDIKDQEINDNDINNILDEISNIQQNEFNLEQVINKLILNCSYNLPQITSSFLKIFVFNQVNNHQACKNCCLYLYKQNQLFQAYSYIIDHIYIYRNDIYDWQATNYYVSNLDKKYKLLNYQIIKKIQFTKNEINQILLFLIKGHKIIKQYKFYIPVIIILLVFYNWYVKNNQYEKKIFINLIVRYIIQELKLISNYRINRYYITPYIEAECYLMIFDFIKYNWKFINRYYKQIYKYNIYNWLFRLRKFNKKITKAYINNYINDLSIL